MSLVVPWRELVGLIQPFAPTGTGAKGRRLTFAVETMLRIHFLPQWFGLSDPAMEEALHDTPLYCEFARLDAGLIRMPDETTILRFRHLLEEHNLSNKLYATTVLTTTGDFGHQKTDPRRSVDPFVVASFKLALYESTAYRV